MNIVFLCETNMPDKPVMINSLVFLLKDGSYLTVDRDETCTNAVVEGKYFSMIWKNCYLWSICDRNIFGDNGYRITDIDAINEFKELVAGVTAYFEIEDDAPEGYEVKLLDYGIE